MYIIIDDKNIVIDVCSDLDNCRNDLLLDKNNKQIQTTLTGICCGDTYDPNTKTVTKKTTEDILPEYILIEDLINDEMRRLAIKNLKERGLLKSDYVDKIVKE